jgi:hypothetical protein
VIYKRIYCKQERGGAKLARVSRLKVTLMLLAKVKVEK